MCGSRGRCFSPGRDWPGPPLSPFSPPHTRNDTEGTIEQGHHVARDTFDPMSILVVLTVLGRAWRKKLSFSVDFAGRLLQFVGGAMFGTSQH